MSRYLSVAVVLGASLIATPAWALFCSDEGPTVYETVYDNGEYVYRVDDSARARLDLQRLREIGVPATRVERWNGCMRAFVSHPGGGSGMEFYDPVTLRRVQ